MCEINYQALISEAITWPAPATRRVVARFPGLLWEVLPGALGGQVRCITSAPTTQGDGGNPQAPPGKPPGAHPNSPGKQLQPVETTCTHAISSATGPDY